MINIRNPCICSEHKDQRKNKQRYPIFPALGHPWRKPRIVDVTGNDRDGFERQYKVLNPGINYKEELIPAPYMETPERK